MTLLVPADVAAPEVGLSARSLLEWARRGVVPCHRLGRKYLFNLAALERWAEGYSDTDAGPQRGQPLSQEDRAVGRAGHDARRPQGQPLGEDPRRSQGRTRRAAATPGRRRPHHRQDPAWTVPRAVGE